MAAKLDGPFGRLIVRVSGTRTFMRIAPIVVPRLDRLVHKISGGRMISGSGLLTSLVLTTTGAKSGQRRTTPLATKPDGDSFYVVGSNFGRDTHPAWTANLIEHPDAEVSFKGETIPVRARLLTSEEKAEVWPALVEFWPNYDLYVERSGRDLRVFRLDRR